ncbi:MAG: GNAT family N-acetyltransferase [Woeseia sp.]
MTTSPSAEPVIRTATAQDVTDIHALLLELAIATGTRARMRSTPEDLLRDGFGKQPQFEALLAVQRNQGVGLALYFYEYSTWRGQTGIYLQDIVVMPDYRGSGLAQRLMRATARAGRQHGAGYLRLSVAAQNEGAIRFYRALGFELSADERIFMAKDAAFDQLSGES